MIAIRTLLATSAILACLAQTAWAGCSSDEDEDSGEAEPKARLCLKGECEITEIERVCGNAYGFLLDYRNGLTVHWWSADEEKGLPESVTISRKYQADDVTCEDIDEGACPPGKP